MTAEIELLPLPEGEASSFGNYEVHDNEAMVAYARANIARAVAPLQAEIERLKAEVERLKSMTAVTMGVGYSNRGGNANWQGANLHSCKTYYNDDGKPSTVGVSISVGRSDGPGLRGPVPPGRGF